ncbi:symplekin tight junction carboxy-terminal protein, putative [Babesia ovis]|uniref:Symplekin tight junction carboxy-terminal protein, putative n=1 Tax=Babesia ovis TaxID=5869 RepID=A0A9W5TB01_BABOV|nr:symplekin tight junction carboxy-terminal protein, putative [Babesia ovis]
MGQEAEILNLLRTGQRDAFEARLQQFRRLQLTQSKAGKGKLSRLINHVLHIDGQYATVLIEDMSNLLNDSEIAVRTEALAAFAASAHLFMFHILLSRAFYPSSSVAKDAFADLACALSLVQHAAVEMDASDGYGKNSSGSISDFVHSGLRSPVANALRVVMMELAVLAQLGVTPSKTRKDGTKQEPSRGVNLKNTTSEAKDVEVANRRYDMDDWRSIVNNDAQVMAQLEAWSTSATRLICGCISTATKSNKTAAIARSVMAAEVATTLISHYPDQYFQILATPLVATHTHLFKTVSAYENMILRIFTSPTALPYHTQLVALLKDAGYQCELVEIYKRAHVTAAGNKCYVYNGEGNVLEDDAVNIVTLIEGHLDPEERFQLARKKLEHIWEPEQLQKFKAARIFKCDPVAIKNMHSPDNLFSCTTAEMRLEPPKEPMAEPSLDIVSKPNAKYVLPSDTVDVVPTKCETIREYNQLYSALVATQMMDTAVSYTWHLRDSVISGNRRNKFDVFNRALFNKIFLTGALPIETQRNLFVALMDHMAQMVMISCSATGVPGQKMDILVPALADARNVGVSELLGQLASEHRSEPLEKLLEHMGQLLMTKASIELAMDIVQCDKKGKALAKVDVKRMGYSEMVEMVLNRLYAPSILKVVEVRDAYVLQLCKFILNLPVVPLSLVKQINEWVADPSSIRLAFSLTSNILKKSQSTDLKQQVLVLFLRFVTSENPDVRNIFQRLISSPKGLYHSNPDGRRYSISDLETAHEKLVEWIRADGGCSKCKIGAYLSKDLVEQCEAMVSRPLWQWPSGLINQISNAHKNVETPVGGGCSGCEWHSLVAQLNQSSQGQAEIEWSLLSSVWLEELFAMLARRGSFNAHPLLLQIVADVLQERENTECVEPLIVAAGKNPALVPFVCDITDDLTQEALISKARQSCCAHIGEIAHVLRQKPEANEFLMALIADVRTMWLDPRYKFLEVWQQEPSHAKLLVDVALQHLETCEEYVMQLTPFLGVDQLEVLVTHLFNNGTEEGLKRVLSILVDVPHTFRREQKELNLALPQHFMYQCYNVKPIKEQLKRQTGLLDHCVDCCVSGTMSVEAALSACTLIVESPEMVSFVFGRVLCQLVQKVPQTRSVVVQSILPALFKRSAWLNKMLWRGVIICMTTLWPGHKENLCRLLLLLPPEYGEATIKTLQTQHNVIAYMESTLPQLDHSVHIPAYIKMMLSL